MAEIELRDLLYDVYDAGLREDGDDARVKIDALVTAWNQRTQPEGELVKNGVLTMNGRTCPDGGLCHHRCHDDDVCWRVKNAAPLSSYGNEWNLRTKAIGREDLKAQIMEEAKAGWNQRTQPEAEGEVVTRAREGLRALYIATDESVARDLNERVEAAFAFLTNSPPNGSNEDE